MLLPAPIFLQQLLQDTCSACSSCSRHQDCASFPQPPPAVVPHTMRLKEPLLQLPALLQCAWLCCCCCCGCTAAADAATSTLCKAAGSSASPHALASCRAIHDQVGNNRCCQPGSASHSPAAAVTAASRSASLNPFASCSAVHNAVRPNPAASLAVPTPALLRRARQQADQPRGTHLPAATAAAR